MKVNITHHKGKGAQPILPSRAALNKLVQQPSISINQYAKAGPDVVQNGPSIVGEDA